MRTYTTLDSTVIDVDSLSTDEAAFVEQALRDYRADVDWHEFTSRIFSTANPLLGAGHTRSSYDAPAMLVLRDLRDRLGITQGTVRAEPGDDIERDPLEDEFVTMSEAAVEVGVSRMAVHKAATRGDVVATAERPARVSRRSIEAWRKAPRQRKAAKAATGPTRLDSDAILAAIDKLSPREQRVIYMRFAGDLTVEEIADVMRLPATAVREAERNARKTIRKLIDVTGT